MSMRRPRRTGETMAEAMDSVFWDYTPERERLERGYSAGEFFDSFQWTERKVGARTSAEAEAGLDETEEDPGAGT